MSKLTHVERAAAIKAISSVIQALMPEDTIDENEVAEIVILAVIEAGGTEEAISSTLIRLYGEQS